MPLFNKDEEKKWVGTCPPCLSSSDAPVLLFAWATSGFQKTDFIYFVQTYNLYYVSVLCTFSTTK